MEAPEADGSKGPLAYGRTYGSLPEWEKTRAPREMTWVQATGAINASVIGFGVLCIPHAFTHLGWVAGGLGLLICLAGNAFVAHLMREIQRLEPSALSMADAAYVASGEREGARLFVQVVLYSEKVAGLCPALALMASTLGSGFYQVHICQMWWCLIVLAALIPAGQLKSIKDTNFVNLVNMQTIVAAAIMTVVALSSTGPARPERHVWPIADAARPLEFFSAINVMVFAFAGNWLYFEVMAEMERPHEFIKAFAVAGPMQLGLYGMVGFVGYAYWGTLLPSNMIDALKFGRLMRATVFVLFVHCFAGAVTGSTVIFRFLMSRISPKDVNDDTWHARMGRFLLVSSIWGLVFVVVLVVPDFGSLVSLLGALLEAPISFVLPVVSYVGVVRRHRLEEPAPPLWLWIACAVVASVGSIVTVLGTIEAIGQLNLGDKPPFSCVCQGIWDTCECSSARLPPSSCPAVVPG